MPDFQVCFQVFGLPQPQGSARGFVVGRRAIITTDDPKLRSWRRDAVLATKEVLAGRSPWPGPVEVVARFTWPRPAGHFGKRGLRASAPLQKITAPDVDRCARGLLDALMVAGVIRDDAQVVRLNVSKGFGEPLTQVEVRSL